VGLLGLVLLAALIFVLGNLVILPLLSAAWSLAGALTAPGQFLSIAADRRLRQNHALEHATLNVLERRLGPQRLAGLARPDGFILRGLADPEAVRLAAAEGLARLKAGESHLALHDRCGTSIATANFVTSVALLGVLLGLGRFSLANVVLAMVLANASGPFLGRLCQRFLTTTPDVGDLYIVGFECRVAEPGWGALLVNPFQAGVPVVCLVRTVSVPRGGV